MKPETTKNKFVFFVDDQSMSGRRQARSYLAQKGLRKRVSEQAKKDTAKHPSKQLSSQRTVPSEDNRILDVSNYLGTDKVLSTIWPAKQPTLSRQTIGELRSPISDSEINDSWGISLSTSPSPAQLSYNVFQNCTLSRAIVRSYKLFDRCRFGPNENTEEQTSLRLLAHRSRGRVIAMARDMLFGKGNAHGSQSLTKCNDVTFEMTPQVRLGVIFQLLWMDFRYAPEEAKFHFEACRQIIRGQLLFHDSEGPWPMSIQAIVSILRNPHLHRLIVAFECAHCGVESIIWNDSDLYILSRNLSDLVDRLLARTAVVGEDYPDVISSSIASPRIVPDSLLWRCLSKEPGPIESNKHGDMSEWQGQLASLLSICSIFVDYEDSSPEPAQCAAELDDALVALGEIKALSSVLNLAWLVAGGVGIPIVNKKERIWSALGMLFVLKHQHAKSDGPNESVCRLPIDNRLSWVNVRRVCLEFLSRPPTAISPSS